MVCLDDPQSTFERFCPHSLLGRYLVGRNGSRKPDPVNGRPPLIFPRTYRALGLYIRHIPRPSQHCKCISATVDIHHVACLLSRDRSDCTPWVSIPSSPGGGKGGFWGGVTAFTSTSTNLDELQRLAHTLP